MAYTPDPTNVNQPDDTVLAESATAEFRALKAYIKGFITTATSTTSMAPATGNISFTTQTGLTFYTGQFVQAISASANTNWMYGQVVSYNTSTGALVINVVSTNGSATKSDWTIGPSGIQGPAGVGTGAVSIGVSGDIAVYAGAGNTLGDSGVAISTDGTFAANSNALIPTQQAIKTYLSAAAVGIESPVRQTVLSGDSSSGTPNWLTTGSGLTPAYTATAPLVITYACGFGISGAVDKVSVISAGGSTAACSANTLSYILATYASATSVTWSTTIAPPQYTPYYTRPQISYTLNNTALDDFGTAALTGIPGYSNAFPAIASTYYATFNGSQYVGSVIVPLGTLGNGGWTVRQWFKISSLSSQNAILSVQGLTGYGVNVFVNTSGKTVLYLSSTGTSNDIANGTVGTATISAVSMASSGGWHFAECTYDPVAGKYYLYIDGVVDQTVTSSSKICYAYAPYVGIASGNGSSYYLTGGACGLEIFPYCLHPAGTSYSVPTALGSFAIGIPMVPWFDTVNYQWKTPSSASVVSGNNPTFTATQTVCVGEATAGVSTISSVISYAYQGQFNSANNPITFTTGTAYTWNHNIGVNPDQIRLVTLTRTAATAPWLEGANAYNGSAWFNTQANLNRNTAQFLTGASGVMVYSGTTATSGQIALVAKRAF